MKKFKLNLRKDAKFVLYEYKNKNGINYCLKDERGEILMNIESSKMLGDRILINVENVNNKEFEVQLMRT